MCLYAYMHKLAGNIRKKKLQGVEVSCDVKILLCL